MTRKRQFLRDLLDTAIRAADPAYCLPPHLPEPPRGKLIILAAGKAAGSMTAAATKHYDAMDLGRDRLMGIAVTRHGYAMNAGAIPVIEAGHPVPDEAGIGATQSAIALADLATADDMVLVLLSGGASANWIAPNGLSLADKQALTRDLLRSGANIGEINTIRRHLSAIKGGRLAARAQPAPVLTLAISDVPGDVPEAIGSGPTVADPTTLDDALAVMEKYRIRNRHVRALLTDPAMETPKPDDPLFDNTQFILVSRPADALQAAARQAEGAGYAVVDLGDSLEGEAWKLGGEQVKACLEAGGPPTLYLSGGEATVTVRGNGRGGPNQEFALGAAIAMDGAPHIAAIAADTDGTDGGAGNADDPAGAIADGETVARARSAGLDPVAMLTNNDSTSFFDKLGDLVQTGPTYTNVNDFRAILFDPRDEHETE